MATKKISLNELRNIVKQIIKENTDDILLSKVEPILPILEKEIHEMASHKIKHNCNPYTPSEYGNAEDFINDVMLNISDLGKLLDKANINLTSSEFQDAMFIVNKYLNNKFKSYLTDLYNLNCADF